MGKKKISASERRDRLLGFVTAMPAMILLFIFTVYPVFYLIYYSLFSGSLISTKKTFVGLDNYRELWASETFHKVLMNTVVYTEPRAGRRRHHSVGACRRPRSRGPFP